LGSVTLPVVAAGDSSAELYRTHYAGILRLCRLLLANPHEAEETAQEVFLTLVRQSHASMPIRAGPAWLTRVAVPSR
jgi:DNA-directed RNA polymerase specialized sigma24 family protein